MKPDHRQPQATHALLDHADCTDGGHHDGKQPGHFDPAYPGRSHEPGPDNSDPWADDTWDMALPGQQAALEALRWNWGEVYEIGCDEGLWWCCRRDGKGGRETAATPDELRTSIVTDYTVFPVDRAALPPRPGQPAPGDPASDCEAGAIQWT